MQGSRFLKITVSIVLGFLVYLLAHPSFAKAVKVRVTVDNAGIKAAPEIGGPTLANLSLGRVLDSEAKQGEWYKVSVEKDGGTITGFIHELLVEEVTEGGLQSAGPATGMVRTQPEIAAEIELKIDENRSLIRQDRDLAGAAENLRPLIAKAFSLEDHQRQKQIACEIFLWLALASAKQGDSYAALKEFRNMFEVDYLFAKNISRNIYDPVASGLIDHAEKQYKGVLVEYTFEVITEPKEAAIQVDGRDVGVSPEVIRTITPKFTLEIVKEGYRPIKEDIFLSEASSKKSYSLESIGRSIRISSVPPGALVFIDGEDTGKVTDCELPFVPYGSRAIRLQKQDWADWEETLQLIEGTGPVTFAAVLTVKNYAFARKWGGGETKLFKLPRAIAVDQEGNLYVGDESDFKVRKFDPQGRLQSGWGEASREFRPLKEPAGIIVDGQGFIYISDAKGACVFKFAKSGKFVSKWGKLGAQPGEMNLPSGLAIDRGGDIYVADSGNNRVVKYSTGGVVKKTWGKQGTGKGEFVSPAAIAVSRNNEVFVLDRMRVQKFTPDGEFLAAWGKAGTGAAEFNKPQGFCLDRSDYIFIADTGNSRVLKFDSGGKYITQIGAPGAADGQMTAPVAVGVNDKGSVFVVESTAGRLQEFASPGK